MALRHWLQLSMTRGLGPILSRRLIASVAASPDTPPDSPLSLLLNAPASAARACAATESELRRVEGISSKARAIHQALHDAQPHVDEEIERCHADGIALLCPEDDGYPTLLRSAGDAPCVLYVRGDLQPRDLNSLAIVGSRKCSHYGLEQADRFASLLAGAGITVISGGARGVDSAAHRGALRHADGRTIAVLGCGVDHAYPPENKPLFDQIASSNQGAVISEYPLGTPPAAENFPRRNRIIAGLSRGVLVVEADARSGSLITARQANEDYNRTVFALPGRLDNPLSAGPHKLIRDGAILVTSLPDILEGLGPLPDFASQPTTFELGSDILGHIGPKTTPAPSTARPPSPTLSPRQLSLLQAMDHGPAAVDTLIDRTGLDAQTILSELTLLSLKGTVKRLDGQTYQRTPASHS